MSNGAELKSNSLKGTDYERKKLTVGNVIVTSILAIIFCVLLYVDIVVYAWVVKGPEIQCQMCYEPGDFYD